MAAKSRSAFPVWGIAMSSVMRSIASAIARWKDRSAVPAAVASCRDGLTCLYVVWAAAGPTSSTTTARYGNSLLMGTPFASRSDAEPAPQPVNHQTLIKFHESLRDRNDRLLFAPSSHRWKP